MADNETLASWLKERTESAKPPIVKAVYEGLRMRVERGDFDHPELENRSQPFDEFTQ